MAKRRSSGKITDSTQITVALIGLIGAIISAVIAFRGFAPEIVDLVRTPTATYTPSPTNTPVMTPTRTSTPTLQPTFLPTSTPTHQFPSDIVYLFTVRVVDRRERPVPDAIVSIFIPAEERLAEITDNRGFANFVLPPQTERFRITVSAIGYQSQVVVARPDDQIIIIELLR